MKSTKENLIEKTKQEIETCQIMIGFYEKMAKEQDKEESAKTLLKAEQIKKSLTFNTAFDEYLKSL
jgi:hypothetical protein